MVRCPKCNASIQAQTNPAAAKSGLAIGSSPATEHKRYEHVTPAPLFELEGDSSGMPARPEAPEELSRVLVDLIRSGQRESSLQVSSANQREALLCLAKMHRETAARGLAAEGYRVFVAEDTRQAIDRMRESQLQVVVLDPEFDLAEQGAAFITREVNVLRPMQRRRLFFVLVSPSLRTMDSHTAFLNNVNAIINIGDINELAKILHPALREYNELYKDFNAALSLPAL